MHGYNLRYRKNFYVWEPSRPKSRRLFQIIRRRTVFLANQDVLIPLSQSALSAMFDLTPTEAHVALHCRNFYQDGNPQTA